MKLKDTIKKWQLIQWKRICKSHTSKASTIHPFYNVMPAVTLLSLRRPGRLEPAQTKCGGAQLWSQDSEARGRRLRS